jgi:hypothetical protein
MAVSSRSSSRAPRRSLALLLALASGVIHLMVGGGGCGHEPAGASSTASTGGSGGGADPLPDPKALQSVFAAVDQKNLEKLLAEVTGVAPVTVDGATLHLTERWSAAGKASFRAYWKQYFTALGATVSEIPFPVDLTDIDPDHVVVGETTGHNVEAVLPGDSADSVVIVVHYDSVGLKGLETQNPAADDDGSGLVTLLEAARIFAARSHRARTVRFVAADYEEISNDLLGDLAYVAYLQKESKAKGFKILVAADNDQTAWSCWDEQLCRKNAPPANGAFRLTTCSGDKLGYDYPDLLKGVTQVAATYSTMQVQAACDGSGDTDHYAFWQAGIPAYVIEEIDADLNPHYDDNDTGDDTLAHVNTSYLFKIAQVAITYQAELAGIGE